MPGFIWLPSSLAEPVKAAEIPSRISLSVTPRMVGARSVALRTAATRDESSLMARGSVGAGWVGGGAGGARACYLVPTRDETNSHVTLPAAHPATYSRGEF